MSTYRVCFVPLDIILRMIGTVYLSGSSAILILVSCHYPAKLYDDILKLFIGFDAQIFGQCIDDNENDDNDDFLGLLHEKEGQLPHPITRQIYIFSSTSKDLCNWFPPLYLGFSMLFVLSSVSLILSSIVKRPWMSAPWLVCAGAHGCLQATTAIVCATRYKGEFDTHTALLISSTLHLLVTIFFFGTVVFAQFIWGRDKKELKSLNLSFFKEQEAWENIIKSPPCIRSPYSHQV